MAHYMVGQGRSNFINPKGTYTPLKGCVCAILNKSNHGFQRSALETKCGQKSGILKLILADRRLFMWVNFHKPRKAHLHH